MQDMVIHTPTEEESWMLRKVLDGLGVVWSCSSDSPSSWSNFEVYDKQTCYHIWSDGTLTFGELQCYRADGYTVLSLDEAMELLGVNSIGDPESVSDLESIL